MKYFLNRADRDLFYSRNDPKDRRLGELVSRVSIDEIKIAYREQAKKYHPDVNIGNKNAEERFKDINEAYKVLSDFTSKKKYDRMWNTHIGRKKVNYDEELLVLFYSTLNFIKEKYAFDFYPPQNYELIRGHQFENVLRKGCRYLKSIKYKYWFISRKWYTKFARAKSWQCRNRNN